MWHLEDSYHENQFKRKWTKPFLLPLIIAYLLLSVFPPPYILLAALITSWLGDIFLMKKGSRWFLIGGIFFLASHILFIFTYVPYIQFTFVKWYFVIPVAAVYFGISLHIIKLLIPTVSKLMRVPMCVYLFVNSTMNIFAFMMMISNFGAASVVAFCGAVLFFISDCSLYIVRYYRKKNVIFGRHFTVMLTYVGGVFLITQGMIMMLS